MPESAPDGSIRSRKARSVAGCAEATKAARSARRSASAWWWRPDAGAGSRQSVQRRWLARHNRRRLPGRRTCGAPAPTAGALRRGPASGAPPRRSSRSDETLICPSRLPSPEHLPGRGDDTRRPPTHPPSALPHRHDGDGRADAGTDDACAHDRSGPCPRERCPRPRRRRARTTTAVLCACTTALAFAPATTDARAHDGHAGEITATQSTDTRRSTATQPRPQPPARHDLATTAISHAQVVTWHNERRNPLGLRHHRRPRRRANVLSAAGSGLLALIADSGHHMVSGRRRAAAGARRSPSPRGATPPHLQLHRVRVLATLANGAALLLLAVPWIVWGGGQAHRAADEVLARPLVVATVASSYPGWRLGAVVGQPRRRQPARRAAARHRRPARSVGANAAAIGNHALTGLTISDPILSVLVAVLVVPLGLAPRGLLDPGAAGRAAGR